MWPSQKAPKGAGERVFFRLLARYAIYESIAQLAKTA